VLKTVQAIANGDFPQIPQQTASTIKQAPKIFKETCEINWNQSVKKIYDFVRGLSPYPTAWTVLNGKTYKIYAVHTINREAGRETPGSLHTDGKGYIYIKAEDGWIAINELQPEGKKKMKTEEFLRGNKL
jgi:methionyl-tRNA formyltransferase